VLNILSFVATTDINTISNGILPHFKSPLRPDYGTEGRNITLKVNHFQVSVPKGFIHHYDINIHPDKCPRRVNRYGAVDMYIYAYLFIFGHTIVVHKFTRHFSALFAIIIMQLMNDGATYAGQNKFVNHSDVNCSGCQNIFWSTNGINQSINQSMALNVAP